MARIRPISDLRNRSQELSAECHRTGEPILITKNGREDLVLMSVARFERDQARIELYRALDDAEQDVRRGDRGVSASVLRKKLGIATPSRRRRTG
jgi:prevent-host-death family protein